MKNQLIQKMKPVLKAIKLDVIYFYFLNNIYVNRIAVPCEKDLSSLQPIAGTLEKAGVGLVSVTSDSLSSPDSTSPKIQYSDQERLKVALAYLQKGYHGVAVVKDQIVYGDIWYTSRSDHNRKSIHPDLDWLKMDCGAYEAYAFDMYLNPDKRGMNLANILQSGALHEMSKRGYRKALGYYWADYVPALWVHRTLKWKELHKLKVTRLLWFYSSRPADHSGV